MPRIIWEMGKDGILFDPGPTCTAFVKVDAPSKPSKLGRILFLSTLASKVDSGSRKRW